MANIKSAMKRVKITEKQTMNNRAAKSEMKTTIRRFDEALQAGDATAKGMIHKNAAARKKAQMAKKRAAAQ